jgi:hypothetical protein
MPDPTDPVDPNAPAPVNPTPAPPTPTPTPIEALNAELAAKATLAAANAAQSKATADATAAATAEAAARATLGLVVASRGALVYTQDGTTATVLLPNADGTYHEIAGTLVTLTPPVTPPAA